MTSAKAGNGVELLRDDRDDTYWQSDGAQPHLININFPRKVLPAHRPLWCGHHAQCNSALLPPDALSNPSRRLCERL